VQLKASPSRHNWRNRWWCSPSSFLSFLKYLEPKINGWLRTQVRSTGAPRCFARQVLDEAFFGAAAFFRVVSGVIEPERGAVLSARGKNMN